MMAKEPTGRYPTPERAAQALQVLLVAGAEAQVNLEGDPQMRSYLTWLEREEAKGAPGTSAAAGTALPVAAPVDTPVALKPSSGTLPAAPSGKPPSGSMPVAKVPKPAKSGQAAQFEGIAKVRPTGEKRRKKQRRPPSSPAAAPIAAAPWLPERDPISTVDVELIPGAVLTPTEAPAGLNLSRRDLLLFGIGAGAGSLATFLGCLLALSRKDRSPLPPEDEHKTKDKEP
jgi:hypothetical protein